MNNSELADWLELKQQPGWRRLENWLLVKAALRPHDLLRNLKTDNRAANDIAIVEANAYLSVLRHVDKQIQELKDKADKP